MKTIRTKNCADQKKPDIFAPKKIESYGDFLALVKSLDIYIRDRDPENDRNKGDYITVEWSTGGMSGTGYDGSGENEYTSADAPEELEAFDLIIEKIAPEISFMRYKALTREVVVDYDRSYQGYYGDSTNYAGKNCNLRRLYDELKKRGMI